MSARSWVPGGRVGAAPREEHGASNWDRRSSLVEIRDDAGRDELCQPCAGQGVAGSAFGVDRIGLRYGSACRADRAVELDDQLTELVEVSG